MARAKSIDRLALTREEFGHKLKYGDEILTASSKSPNGSTVSRHVNILYGYEPDDPSETEHREGYSTCPSCGQETLIHEDGCKHCRSCGWSACG